MAVAKRISGAAALAAAAVLTGALASLVPPAGLLLLMAAFGLLLAAALIRFRASAGEKEAWHPIVMLLTGAAVVSVAWSGMPPAGAAAPDLVLLAALAALVFCWAQDSVQIPVPAWLVGTAAILLASQLLNQFFLVTNPPQDQPPSFTPVAAPLFTLAKVEFGMLIIPIVIGAVASSWRRANLIANLWVLSATISAAIAVVDSATGAGIGVSITGISQEAGRVAGLTNHPNALALTGDMALPIALLRAGQLRGWGRAASITSAGLLFAGILASGSRVGLFAAVLVIGLMGVLIARLRGRIIVAGLAAVIAFVLFAAFAPGGSSLFSGVDRLEGGGSATGATTQRFDQLHESIALAWGHPVTGIGFQVVADAHNLPVQFWEAAGFLGVLALVLFLTGVFRTAYRLYRDPRLPRGSPEFVGALTISVAVWLISGLLQNPIADRYIYVPVGLLLGLGLAARASGSEPEHFEPARVLVPARPPLSVPQDVERVPVTDG
jgi:O-antigen ligase